MGFFTRNPLETSFSAVLGMSKPRCRTFLRRGFVLLYQGIVKQPNFYNTFMRKSAMKAVVAGGFSPF